MIILGIETSCDETAVSIIEGDYPRESAPSSSAEIRVLGNALYSQIKIHEKYGGVYPMLAKREHSKNLVPLLKNAMEEAGLKNPKSEARNPKQTKPNGENSKFKTKKEKVEKILEREPELLKDFLEFMETSEKPPIDAIAVTNGPGLEPALWVGVNFAKALSEVWDAPIVPVNHMEGHIFASLLQKRSEENSKSEARNPKQTKPNGENSKFQTGNQEFLISNFQFPVLALLISGGHTELVYSEDWFKYKIIGKTRDDAVGEAFDKAARIMGLPYPGGPSISAKAEIARTNADLTQKNADKEAMGFLLRQSAWSLRESALLRLPRPMLHSKDFDFSFSGLKTALLYAVKKMPPLSEDDKKNISREFEDAVVEVLVSKTKKALKEFPAKTLVLGGGVTANKEIRKNFEKLAEEFSGLKLFIPQIDHSTDNSIMIALSGLIRLQKGALQKGDGEKMVAEGNLTIATEERNMP